MPDDVPPTTEVAVLVTDQAVRDRVRSGVVLAGYRPVLPRPLLDWVLRTERAVLVTDDDGPTRAVRASLARVGGDVAFVVLVADDGPRVRRLLADGSAVLPSTTTVEQVSAAVRAARHSLACLPAATARLVLTGDPAGPGPAPALGEREQDWLRALVEGSTVAALARSAGYSQREMYRLLADVYARLGASTRTEALLLADRHGLLGARDGDPARS